MWIKWRLDTNAVIRDQYQSVQNLGYTLECLNMSAVTRTDESVKMVHIHNARRRDRFVGSCDRR